MPEPQKRKWQRGKNGDRGVSANRSQFVTGCANFPKVNHGIPAGSIRY